MLYLQNQSNFFNLVKISMVKSEEENNQRNIDKTIKLLFYFSLIKHAEASEILNSYKNKKCDSCLKSLQSDVTIWVISHLCSFSNSRKIENELIIKAINEVFIEKKLSSFSSIIPFCNDDKTFKVNIWQTLIAIEDYEAARKLYNEGLSIIKNADFLYALGAFFLKGKETQDKEIGTYLIDLAVKKNHLKAKILKFKYEYSQTNFTSIDDLQSLGQNERIFFDYYHSLISICSYNKHEISYDFLNPKIQSQYASKSELLKILLFRNSGMISEFKSELFDIEKINDEFIVKKINFDFPKANFFCGLLNLLVGNFVSAVKNFYMGSKIGCLKSLHILNYFALSTRKAIASAINMLPNKDFILKSFFKIDLIKLDFRNTQNDCYNFDPINLALFISGLSNKILASHTDYSNSRDIDNIIIIDDDNDINDQQNFDHDFVEDPFSILTSNYQITENQQCDNSKQQNDSSNRVEDFSIYTPITLPDDQREWVTKNKKSYPTIEEKYFNRPLPKINSVGMERRDSIESQKKYLFEPITNDSTSPYQKKEIFCDGLHADYYSTDHDFDKFNRYTFVRTGRTVHALIPKDKNEGKIVMVATENEFPIMKSFINEHRDLFIIKAMPGYQESIADSIGNSSVRRLAILYLAWIKNIKDIIILDDNIESFHADDKILPVNCQWDGIYNFYKHAANNFNLACLSVQSYNPISMKRLTENKKLNINAFGYKALFINIELIKSKISSPQYLLPQNPKLWGEDIFFQCALRNANLNIGSFSKETLLISRSKTYKNSSVGKVNPKSWLTYNKNENFPEFYNKSIDDMQKIYAKSENKYNKKEERLKNLNLSSETSKLIEKKRLREDFENDQISDSFDLSEKKAKKFKKTSAEQLLFKNSNEITSLSDELLSEYIENLNNLPNFLRQPQIEAIQNLSTHLKNNEFVGHFNMATGIGKTVIYSYLALELANCDNFKSNILLVSVGIQPCHQIYETLIPLKEKMGLNIDIILINSESISQEVLNINKVIQNESKKIYIFCEESAKIYLSNNPNMLDRFGFIVMDEFHDFNKNFVSHLIKRGEQKNSIVLGFSATPPNIQIKEIYRYPLERGYREGFLTPWIIDKIRLPFLEKNPIDYKKYEKLLNQLPIILKNHIHPHGNTLSENQGIIRVGKKDKTAATKVANQVAELLTQNNISASPYHSNLNEMDRNIILKNFMKRKFKVLVVVDMLGQAFDAQVDYVFFTRNFSSMTEYFQNLGRVVRPDYEMVPENKNYKKALGRFIPSHLKRNKIGYMIIPDHINLESHCLLSKDDPVWSNLNRSYKKSESSFLFNRENTFPIVSQIKYRQHDKVSLTKIPVNLDLRDFIRLPLKRNTPLEDLAILSLNLLNKNELVVNTLKNYFQFILTSKNETKKKDLFTEIKNKGDIRVSNLLPQLKTEKKGFITIYTYESETKKYVFKEFIGVHGTHFGTIFEKKENEYEILIPLNLVNQIL